MAALEKYRVNIGVPAGEAPPDVFSICFEPAPKDATPDQKRVDILAQKDRAVAFSAALITDYGPHARRSGLIIIGAGVAGVVAALAAAQNGIGVTLLEEQPEIFSRQANSEKYIYPKLYSWPSKGWEMPEYIPPAGQENVFFQWKNDRALNVAKAWEAQAKHIDQHIHDSLKPKWDEIGKPTVDKNKKKLSEMFHKLNPAILGGRPLLFALGFYQDKCWINDEADKDKDNAKDLALHAGPPFWGKCDYPDDKCTSIVITGGGDGGLQDFIAISTGWEVHELAEILLNESMVPEYFTEKWRELFAELEDPRDCHDLIDRIIDAFPTNDYMTILGEKTRDRKPVHLLVPTPKLRNCFPLNALFARLIERASDKHQIHFEAKMNLETLKDGEKSGLRTVAWECPDQEEIKLTECELIVRYGIDFFTRY